MPYITSKGDITDSKSLWRLGTITEFIWGIINFIVLFFQTLVNPNKNAKGNKYSSDYRRPGGGGGGGPSRRMGGFGGGGNDGPGPPPMAGG
ncbi:selenoprotein K [Biomphalaria glabrata]|uniref:Selenoprotein K-like n=1 Tax=Biomphalaria glabrata TaxID=6526 RepID=A0A2C9L3C0_BIOGL|nr:selenoprotein K-like [Biomphalaria glabrata]XP_013062581.1 selenoprotein K-like [Biomphalaria glabrata]XP_055884088.1 selenoprotein K-like [Biomphalaria glabrata]KAI8732958.1 selenoprotein K-like [Biomphalaria glabrata]